MDVDTWSGYSSDDSDYTPPKRGGFGFKIKQLVPTKQDVETATKVAQIIKPLEKPKPEVAVELGVAAEPDSPIFPAINRQDFSKDITGKFRDQKIPASSISTERDPNACAKRGAKPLDLFSYQKIIRDYLSIKTPYRGLLIYHGLGSGKTCSSIAVAEGLKTDKEIIIMTKKTLQPGYRSELRKCGDPLFKRASYWQFHRITQPDEIHFISEKYGVNMSEIIRENGGLWFNDNTQKPNYFDLREKERTQIDKQVEVMIDSKYTFYNYNGLREVKVKGWYDEAMRGYNLFDNKVIIIDEFHNLISIIAGGSQIGYYLYELLLSAKNTKIVGLSGTPLINYPHELAILINVLAGYKQVHRFSIYTSPAKARELIEKKRDPVAYIEEMLERFPYLEYWNYQDKMNPPTVFITPNPRDFMNMYDDDGKFLGIQHSIYPSSFNFAEELQRYLTSVGLETRGPISRPINMKQIPQDNSEDFNAMFLSTIETPTGKQYLINPEYRTLIAKSLVGYISYYNGVSIDLFPTCNIEPPTKIVMSEFHRGFYLKKREEEQARESSSKKKATVKIGEPSVKVPSSYKIATRQICNMAYPAPITGMARPYKKKASDADEDIDDSEDDDIKGEYGDQIRLALSKLREHKETVFTGDNIWQYAPKYATILKNLEKCAGTALVFSQFLTLEGLNSMGICLEANGYAELLIGKDANGDWVRMVRRGDKIIPTYKLPAPELADYESRPKYFIFSGEVDVDAKRISLQIFNNDLLNLPESIREELGADTNLHGEILKILMITKTGAEGLDLKNIRQVHIMEPYWNYVLIDQVIGRAVRICSHMDLPLDERHVDVYSYIMTFPERKKKDVYDKVIMFDKNLTTDEYMQDLYERKKKLIESILNMMKRSAVDCRLNAAANGKSANECYSFFTGRRRYNNLYTNFTRDFREWIDPKATKKQGLTLVYYEKMVGNQSPKPTLKTTATGKKVYGFSGSEYLFDVDEYDKNGNLVPIARTVLEDGKIVFKKITATD
jgi:hypothetical protein